MLRSLESLLLFCVMQDITKYEHFASTYMNLVQSFMSTAIIDVKVMNASFFLISLDKTTSGSAVNINEAVEKRI